GRQRRRAGGQLQARPSASAATGPFTRSATQLREDLVSADSTPGRRLEVGRRLSLTRQTGGDVNRLKFINTVKFYCISGPQDLYPGGGAGGQADAFAPSDFPAGHVAARTLAAGRGRREPAGQLQTARSAPSDGRSAPRRRRRAQSQGPRLTEGGKSRFVICAPEPPAFTREWSLSWDESRDAGCSFKLPALRSWAPVTLPKKVSPTWQVLNFKRYRRSFGVFITLWGTGLHFNRGSVRIPCSLNLQAPTSFLGSSRRTELTPSPWALGLGFGFTLGLEGHFLGEGPDLAGYWGAQAGGQFSPD
ncbi:hypothetical protein J0S82_013156, partial [Galemys pyrenaicus]